MSKNYDYIIVGAGPCGLTIAKELSKKNKNVLVLERGSSLDQKKLGTIFYPLFRYDKRALLKSKQGINIYRFFAVGGTSIVSCGNAVEFTKAEYKKIGIDFTKELAEARQESCVREKNLPIGRASARIMKEANKLGYDMKPMPKFRLTDKCISCSRCILGCTNGAKWTSKECLKEVNKEKVYLITRFCVTKVIQSDGKAIGVEGKSRGFRKDRFFADKIILSAGGIGTPIILQNSDIEAGDNLFVDLFNVTYGVSKEFNQRKEAVMSVVCEKFHEDEGFVISPFVDCCAGFIPSVELRHVLNTFKLNRIMGIMTKISDDSVGKIHADGRIDKEATKNDLKKLKRGSRIAREILVKCGVDPKKIFISKIRGAHPGGTAGIGRVVNNNLETNIKNLYACDASVLPFAPGLPPILSLITLAKWFGKKISEN